MAPTQEYVKRIHQSLYPRWNYAGGWISARVSNDDDGMTVSLLGYKEYKSLDALEREILIRKVKASVDSEIPKIYWQCIGTNERDELLSIEEAAAKEAVQNIQDLRNLAADIRKEIENKAPRNLQSATSLFEDTKKALGQNIQVAEQSVEDTKKQTYQLLARAIQGGGEVVDSLQQTVTESWNESWLARIFDAITKGVNLENAKDVVRKRQLDYPDAQPTQIVEHLIRDKAIFAIVVGLDSEAVTKVGGGSASAATLTVDLFSTTSMLVEMCYQIAVAYGVEDLHYPARRGEILAIFGLALGSEQLGKLGVDFLLQHTPITSALINAGTNVIVFQLVGYAAREFYSAKVREKIHTLASTDTFTELETEIKSYLDSAISEKESIEQVVAEAVRIKEQLALS